MIYRQVAANGLRLCEVGEFKVPMLNKPQLLIRIANARNKHSTPILQSPSYWLLLFSKMKTSSPVEFIPNNVFKGKTPYNTISSRQKKYLE
jgi:hypothetical protein